MLRTLFVAALCVFAAACAPGDDDHRPSSTNNVSNNNDDGKGDQTGEVTMCAALRGNGPLIAAHFAALGRIVDHYGPVHAVAGGSSASITSFLLSSIQANPLVFDCNGKRCTDDEKTARIALLLKSFQGYLDYLATSQEATATMAALSIAARIRDADIEQQLSEDPSAAVAALIAILEADEFRDVVNPELIELLATSPRPEYHAADIVNSAENFGDFSTDSPTILVRPGLVNFGALADRLAMLASFYAAYGPADLQRQEEWLNACAQPARFRSWNEIRSISTSKSTCGKEFAALLGDYDGVFLTDDAMMNRVHDNVGTYMPALISTSVLTGDAVTAWESAREQYLQGDRPELGVDFEDVRFGYWGPSEATEMIAEKTTRRPDLKSRKALSLGPATWREILIYSPAEPGLARARHITDESVSAGGWSDLHPVLVLRDIGCDKVVYVTRAGAESRFARGVASLLGMDADTDEALYDLENERSSFTRSVADADAVWCTNWDAISATEAKRLVTDAHDATMFTDDDFFTGGDSPYPDTTTEPDVQGCSL